MTTESSVPLISRVLLIDIDNCPKQIEQLPHTIDQFTRVVACYGGVEPKVPLGIVTFLAQAINSGRLEIVGMKKNGKNAADFGLTFWAGRLMAELPPDTEFIILSQDNDLNHAVNLLRSANRSAHRVDGKKPSPLVSNSVPTGDELIEADYMDVGFEEYISHSLRPGTGRPKSKKTLLNSIKSYFKEQKGVKSGDVMQLLMEHNYITISSQGKVTYVDEITSWDYEDIPF